MPVFPGITDIEAIIRRTKDQCDLVWLENLNLRGGFKSDILSYIEEEHPNLVPLYRQIYTKKDCSYFIDLEKKAEALAQELGCPFTNNWTPYGRAKRGHPVIVDYFYHEEVRNTHNTGVRNRKLRSLSGREAGNGFVSLKVASAPDIARLRIIAIAKIMRINQLPSAGIFCRRVRMCSTSHFVIPAVCASITMSVLVAQAWSKFQKTWSPF